MTAILRLFLNSTLRISHVRTEIMKDCVQWDPVYDTKDFPSGIEPRLLHQQASA